jgi:ankyrin repeat protein
MLQQLGVNASAAERDSGARALHLAAFAGHLAIVEELLAADADPAEPDADLLRPLHYAALTLGRVRFQRQKAVMEALVRSGGEALWAVTANNSLTPLHLAAASGDVELARWLVAERRVMDPRLKSAGTTAAMAAESGNHSGLAASLRAWEAKFWAEGPTEL